MQRKNKNMGSVYTTSNTPFTPYNSPTINRVPIITPRHVPKDIPYEDTPYSKFNPALFKEKFAYPAKEPPKYW